MYCGAPESRERCSAQTVWAQILSMLVHDLQPILVFTCDEVMCHLPASMRDGQERAALLDWYAAPFSAEGYAPLLPAYEQLLEVRAAFTKAYEEAVTSGAVTEKTTQAASASLTLPASAVELLCGEGGVDLSEPLVCSSVSVSTGDQLSCVVEPARGEKCPRCWNWRELGDDGLCPRCHDVVSE